jgi:hypothetical protein
MMAVRSAGSGGGWVSHGKLIRKRAELSRRRRILLPPKALEAFDEAASKREADPIEAA